MIMRIYMFSMSLHSRDSVVLISVIQMNQLSKRQREHANLDHFLIMHPKELP